MLLQIKDVAAVASAERAIRELMSIHTEWFFVQDGGAPLALGNSEFDFSIEHLQRHPKWCRWLTRVAC